MGKRRKAKDKAGRQGNGASNRTKGVTPARFMALWAPRVGAGSNLGRRTSMQTRAERGRAHLRSLHEPSLRQAIEEFAGTKHSDNFAVIVRRAGAIRRERSRGPSDVPHPRDVRAKRCPHGVGVWRCAACDPRIDDYVYVTTSSRCLHVTPACRAFFDGSERRRVHVIRAEDPKIAGVELCSDCGVGGDPRTQDCTAPDRIRMERPITNWWVGGE